MKHGHRLVGISMTFYQYGPIPCYARKHLAGRVIPEVAQEGDLVHAPAHRMFSAMPFGGVGPALPPFCIRLGLRRACAPFLISRRSSRGSVSNASSSHLFSRFMKASARGSR